MEAVFIFGFIIGGIICGYLGKYYWGWRAIRNVTELGHRDLMRRAGLRNKRS